MNDGRRRTWLAHPAVLVAVFAIVVGATLARHEMWHDELNSWDVARDAHSLPGLFANMHFEAHPALWYLCLYLVTRFTVDPRGMQLLHLVIATGTAALIAWKSPFTTLERWLLAFGYFFVFEFAVISRGYALGVLCALAACAVYVKARPSAPLLAILLSLLANTSLYGVFLAVALGAGILLDWRLPRNRVLVMSGLLVVASIIVAMITLYPAPDNAFARQWNPFRITRVEGVVDLLAAAYIPLPDLDNPSPWNTYLLLEDAMQPHALPRGLPAAVFGLVLFLVIAARLRRDRAALTAYLVGTIVMLLFIYLKYSGGMRHQGHLFILFVACIWIARRGVRPAKASAPLVLLLVGQLAAGAFFIVQDLRKPFSWSRELTDYIRALPRTRPVVVAQPTILNYAGPVLSAYLGKPVTYVLGHRVVRGSFMVPDWEHSEMTFEDEITAQLRRLTAEYGTDVYVVTNFWTPSGMGPPIAHFDRHLENDERWVEVYLFKRQP